MCQVERVFPMTKTQYPRHLSRLSLCFFSINQETINHARLDLILELPTGTSQQAKLNVSMLTLALSSCSIRVVDP
jgi:hypothetical protein